MLKTWPLTHRNFQLPLPYYFIEHMGVQNIFAFAQF